MKEVTCVDVKYLRDIFPLEHIKGGDWIDLRCGKTICLHKGEYTKIPLGIAMKLPEGYEAIVVGRSSLYEKTGLLKLNGASVIDESYCGDNDEWMMPVLATRDVTIPKNFRLGQFRILEHQPQIIFRSVDILGNKSRGGFGSTGDI